MFEVTIPFDDIPVFVLGGVTVATVEGQATVEFNGPDGFTVTAITLDGYRKRTDAEREAGLHNQSLWVWVKVPVQLAATDPLYATIKAEVERDSRGLLADKIADAIKERRASAADTRADHLRAGRAA